MTTAASKPKIELWDLNALIPYELNAKKHDPEQVVKIARAIKKHGWDVPIVVDRHGCIIKGHGRRLAAYQLIEEGLTQYRKVPVIVRADLTPDQVKAARLADNYVAVSDIDSDLLRADLKGFDLEELDGIFAKKDLEFMEADLGKINDDAFVEDMGGVVAEQKADVDRRAADAKQARVPLAKAFGFKDVPGSAQIAITRLMASAEARTGKTGADALVDYLETHL